MTINGPSDQGTGFSPALLVLQDSSTNTTNGSGLLELWENNPNHNSYLLWIHGDSTRNSDEPIRFDGPTWGIDEVNTSTDNAHGYGKWKVISSPFQGTILQLASPRAYDNTTFENLLYATNFTQPTVQGAGIWLKAQSLTDDASVLTSSDTSLYGWETQNGHQVSLTAPLNPTASYTFALPSTFNNKNSILYQSDNGRGNNNNARSWAFSGTDFQYVPTAGVSISTLTVSSMTFAGAGDGGITFTIGNSTDGVISSSTQITTGHLLCSGSTNYTAIDCGLPGTGGGTPASPVNSVQYNSAGSFGGSNNFQFNGTSVTVVSSFTINTGGGQSNVLTGLMDVFAGADAFNGRYLFTLGSQNHQDQFIIQDGLPVNMSFAGSQSGNLLVGGTATDSNQNSIGNANHSALLSIQLNDGSANNMTFQTPDAGDGGGDFIFKADTVEALRISNPSGIIAKSSVTITTGGLFDTATGNTASYIAAFSTSSAGVPLVSISTQPAVLPSDYELSLTSAATPVLTFGIQADGHVVSSGTAPSMGTCGSSPSVIGTDMQGAITVGGGVVTSCTLNFANAWANAPVCVESDNSVSVTADVQSITQTAITFGFSATLSGGGTVWYHCFGE